MKNYSLKPTDENAIKLLRDNPIGRNGNVLRFISLLSQIQESCTIAINGEWGSGKTFFVKQVKLILDALNDQSTMDEQTRTEVKRIVHQIDTDVECYSTVYYDAWMYDNNDDPILSLVYATIASNQAQFSETKKRSILGSAAALAGALTGRDINTFLQEVSGKDAFAPFKDADDIREMVKQFINSLIEECGNRLVFFIDELDRCKPDYAIRFMERIKHYFEDDRITFVFSVSISQLQATVKNYYGSEFNATRYLDKFFDLRVSLPTPNIKKFMQTRLGLLGDTLTNTVCIEAVKQYGLSLRETERFVRLVKICAYPATRNASSGFADSNARLFSVAYILPIMLVLQMTDMQAYAKFVSGNYPQPLIDILYWPNIRFEYAFLLYNGETCDERQKTILASTTSETSEIEVSSISVADRLRDVYEAFFSQNELPNSRFGETNIGKMKISDGLRGYIEDTVSLLSQLSDYKYE